MSPSGASGWGDGNRGGLRSGPGLMVALALVVLLGSCGSPDRGPFDPVAVPTVEDPTLVGPPPVSHGLSQHQVDRLVAATVGVRGLDCRRAQVGSGFGVAGGLVVTAAHVVAGIRAPALTIAGRELSSRVVAFDPVSDLAVLEPVGDPDGMVTLDLGEPVGGSVGAVLVHVEVGPRLVPAGIEHLVRATGADVYGRPADGRDAIVLSAVVRTGHSGAAVVDGHGRVVGVTFSRARGGSPVAYAVQAGALRGLLDAAVDSPEPAGPCID